MATTNPSNLILPTDIFPESDSLLLAFLNNSPAIGWLKDADGRHVFLSKPYLERIGVPGDDWFGKTDFDLWPPEVAAKFREDDQKVLQTGELMSFEDRENVTFPNGEERTWWVVKFPFRGLHGQNFVGGMAVDITERKRAEHARKILELEIAEIAEKEQRRIGRDLHDGIGQELTAHAIFAASLATKIDAAAAAGLIDENTLADLQPLANKLRTGIRQSNKHLQSIARGMFPAHVDSNRLMTMLKELTTITDELPGICCSIHGEFHKELDDDVATQLFRIAQEAVNNSVKHGNCSQIKITLCDPDDEPMLSVVDNGGGIENDSIDQSLSSGMGLRIMHYRAELIGATLTIETAIEGGTIVECKLQRHQT